MWRSCCPRPAKMGWFKNASEWLLGRDEYIDEKGGHHGRKKGAAQSFMEWRDNNITQPVVGAIRGMFKIIGDTVFQTAVGLVGKVVGGIKMAWQAVNWVSEIGDAAMSMARDIADRISAAIKSIPSMIKGFFFGTGGGNPSPSGAPTGGGLQKQNWAPSGGGQGIKVQTALHVDGRKMAENVTYHQVRSVQHVASAATFDGRAAPMPGDYAFA